MAIPFVDLEAEYDALKSTIEPKVRGVLADGRYILDDEVSGFESQFAAYLGSNHAVGVNSGTDALELALRAFGVDAGDEVITVGHTYIATVNAIVETGANPVLVDVDPETYCLDVDRLEQAVTEDTAAIIPVHLYGQACDMDSILDVANRHDLYVIEDAAQAHGATYGGETVGTIGDAGCFSFYPVKNLGAYGDGGAVVTDDKQTVERLRMLRNGGQSEKYHHQAIGRNSRLDELQAAILNIKLNYLDEWNDRRREQAALYDELLAESAVQTPHELDDRRHVYHLYVIRHDRRDALRSHLEANDISTLIHYPVPVHQQPAYDDILPETSLPITEGLCDEILSLPIHPYLSDEQIREVTAELTDFC